MTPESQLLYAAWCSNAPRVAELLSLGVPVDTRDGKGRTPLMLAAYTRSPETAQLLLGAGADTQARNKGNRPLIDYASDATTARLILEHTPPALRSATATRLLFTRCNLAALALKAGAHANARNKRGDTPLIYHCWDCGFYNAPLEPIRLLLEAGANPDAINSHGHTPLLMALWTEREAMVRLLISAGAHRLPESYTLTLKQSELLQSCSRPV